MKRLAPLTLLFLSACVAPVARVEPPSPPPPPTYTTLGLERVIGADAAELVRLFGPADAEVREGTARKLQFESGVCVLDAYLYPRGSGEPRVTYLDARQLDGSSIDRASCVAAMTRRGEVK